VTEAREHLADVLVEITTQLVVDSDSAEILRLVTASCTELLNASATGLLLADPRGGVEVVAASDETARFLELLQAHEDTGPCIECIQTGQIVVAPDLRAGDGPRWPAFAANATRAGFAAVHAIPLRLNGRTLGGLNIFHAEATTLPRWQLQAAQGLTDLAVLSLTTEHDTRRGARVAESTLVVLNDRIHLAQAVGLVAGARNIDPATARATIYQHAGRRKMSVRDVSRALTAHDLDPAELTTFSPGG
jgi:GAF domain-containing protein